MRTDGLAVAGRLMSRVTAQIIRYLMNGGGVEAAVAMEAGNSALPRLTFAPVIRGTPAGNIVLTAERCTVSEVLWRILGFTGGGHPRG